MCFDQCHSRSVDRPAYRSCLPAGLCYHPFVCVCTCACVFDGKWGDDPTEPAELKQITYTHYLLGSWAWHGHCYMQRVHAVQTLGGILLLFYLHILRQIRTQHIHTLSACLVGLSSHLAQTPETNWLWSVLEARLTMRRWREGKVWKWKEIWKVIWKISTDRYKTGTT